MSVKITIPYGNSTRAESWLEDNHITSYMYSVTVKLEPDEHENLVIKGCEYEFYNEEARLTQFGLLFS